MMTEASTTAFRAHNHAKIGRIRRALLVSYAMTQIHFA
jgi:hypothetical protein